MTNFRPPNLSGFYQLIIEPRRTIQLNSESARYEAFIDVVPELYRNKYSGLNYIFGGIFFLFWAAYYPVSIWKN